MTYPHIGNYGVNPEDVEARSVFLEGFVVREASVYVSNWRSAGSLDEYLNAYGWVGISEIDTRALVRKIRDGKFKNWVKRYRALAAGNIMRKKGTIDRMLAARTKSVLVPRVEPSSVV